jgi:predicted nucleic acid-binding protein
VDRLFLDANVLFSAAWREGSGVARLWQLEAVELVTSEFAIEEARRSLPDDERVDRLASLLERVRVVQATMPDPASRRGIELPGKDWPIIGGAIAAGATHLITGDARDFGRWFGRRLFGVLVVTPASYLRTVGP